jgi:hypothetical protein
VAERLFPALVHLVRNAVDHAIETPDERVRRGKPEEACCTSAARPAPIAGCRSWSGTMGVASTRVQSLPRRAKTCRAPSPPCWNCYARQGSPHERLRRPPAGAAWEWRS